MTRLLAGPRRSAALLVLAALATPPASAQLEVHDDGHVTVDPGPALTGWTAFQVVNGASANAKRYGLRAHAYDGTYNYGLKGEGFGGEVGIGLWGRAERGALATTGVFADADAKASGGRGLIATGLFARGTHGDSLSFGVRAIAGGYASKSLVYGVHAWTYGDTDTTRYAGYFAGNVHVTGALTTPSDGKLKEGIEALSGVGVLEKVKRLKPKRYRYKQDRRGKKMGLSKRERYGFVAQEVEAVFPELVSEQTHMVPAGTPGGGEGPEAGAMEAVTYKALNYTDLLPVLVQALQEQQAEIEALKEALKGKKK